MKFGIGYDPMQMLTFQMLAAEIQRQALGRYLHQPNNADKIERALSTCVALLKLIQENVKKCPYGSTHDPDCNCSVIGGGKINVPVGWDPDQEKANWEKEEHELQLKLRGSDVYDYVLGLSGGGY